MKTRKSSLLAIAATLFCQPSFGQGQALYSHGSPTADEQYMLELINRARANPAAEGKRLAIPDEPNVEFAIDFFNVNLAKLKRDFASYPVRPPVAMNARLLSAARRHSTDMAGKNFQSHTGSDGSSEQERIDDTGYEISAFNESIYSNLVPNTLYAHCGLNIDWGMGPDGTQPGLGHRMNIMNFGNQVFREVGIGVVSRSGAAAAKYGRLAVTQDFANQLDSPSFLLGVAYYDVDKNGICDPGEGLSGLEARPGSGGFYARTSASGGYAIPFTENTGRETLVFSGGGLEEDESRLFAIQGENEKVDLRIISGPSFLHVEVSDASATEGGKGSSGTASFRIARVGPPNVDLKVVLARAIAGGSGVASPKDYKVSAVKPTRISGIADGKSEFTVVIPKGQRAATLKITAVKDGSNEVDEKAVFRIKNLASYRVASPSAATVVIKD